jgi:hypothetical protein
VGEKRSDKNVGEIENKEEKEKNMSNRGNPGKQ